MSSDWVGLKLSIFLPGILFISFNCNWSVLKPITFEESNSEIELLIFKSKSLTVPSSEIKKL